MHRPARLGVIALFPAIVLAAGCPDPGRAERRWPVMGTYATVEIHAANQDTADEIAERIRGAFDRVDGSMSNWREDSAISRINREAASGPVRVEDPDVYRVLKLAREYARLSDGAFDPTVGPLMRVWGFRPRDPRVPSASEIDAALEHVGWRKFELLPEHRSIRFLDPRIEIDLGGIAKGYALDVALRNFALAGAFGGLLDLGGNIAVWGRPPDAETWTVGIRDPDDIEGIVAELDLRDRAVATSGNYENAFRDGETTYGHLMDPQTGRPALSDVLAATAIADSGAQADAYATAFFVGGSLGVESMLRDNARLEVVMLVDRPEGPTLVASASLRGRLRPTPEFERRLDGRIRFLLPPSSLP
jgi:thiamine biosynthesis lipoprotein